MLVKGHGSVAGAVKEGRIVSVLPQSVSQAVQSVVLVNGSRESARQPSANSSQDRGKSRDRSPRVGVVASEDHPFLRQAVQKGGVSAFEAVLEAHVLRCEALDDNQKHVIACGLSSRGRKGRRGPDHFLYFEYRSDRICGRFSRHPKCPECS